MSSSLVFITGVTGFVGSQTTASVLAAGHRVRLSVRRPEQVEAVKKLFAKYEDKVEVVVVPDIAEKGAFSSFLEGVDYILHIASPLSIRTADLYTGYIRPAVEGTLSILEEAKKTPSVKRVVITASVASLVPIPGDISELGGYVVEENANQAIEINPNHPIPEGPVGENVKYCISKLLAHRATIEWTAKEKPNFDVVTVHPVFVLGIDLWQTTSQPHNVNGLITLSLSSPGKPMIPPSIVDVRDVAEVHLRALTTDQLRPRPEVTEYIASGPQTTWGEIADVVRRKNPAFPIKLIDPPEDKGLIPNATRAERDLGIKWRSTEESIGSYVEQQLSLQGVVAE